MPPLVSIITPCYNQGIYLDDAIASIPYSEVSYEIEHIIINDGSTDPFTIEKLNELEQQGHFIIHQSNQGLAAARNNAIRMAKGKYIIPLDGDNKLHLNYLTKAIDILEKDSCVDIVYGNAIFFGLKEKIARPGKFYITKILKGNYIDACAVYRKDIWNITKGYDTDMPGMGNEDWEFWIHAFFKGARFFYLNEHCFFYRVTNTSMRLSITKDNFQFNRDFILNKHRSYFLDFFLLNYHRINYLKLHVYKASINLLLNRLRF